MGKTGKHSKHRQSLVTLSRRHSMVQMLENLELDGPNPVRIHHPPTNHPPLQQNISTSAKVIQSPNMWNSIFFKVLESLVEQKYVCSKIQIFENV